MCVLSRCSLFIKTWHPLLPLLRTNPVDKLGKGNTAAVSEGSKRVDGGPDVDVEYGSVVLDGHISIHQSMTVVIVVYAVVIDYVANLNSHKKQPQPPCHIDQ